MLGEITELKTSSGLSLIIENAISTLGGDYRSALKRAYSLTTLANTIEIERCIRTLMIIKGKTYAQALEKQNGKVPGELVDLGITQMLYAMRITRGELDTWFTTAEQSKWQFTIYSPLPEKADCRQILEDLRVKWISQNAAAAELVRIEAEHKNINQDKCLTQAGLRASIELGLWPLFYSQHKEQAFLLLQWDELPQAGRLDYFKTLTRKEQEKIWLAKNLEGKTEKETREILTRKMYNLQYGNEPEIDNLNS